MSDEWEDDDFPGDCYEDDVRGDGVQDDFFGDCYEDDVRGHGVQDDFLGDCLEDDCPGDGPSGGCDQEHEEDLLSDAASRPQPSPL